MSIGLFLAESNPALAQELVSDAEFNPALAQESVSDIESIQNIDQSDLGALPRKTASLDQPGVDKVLGLLRSDPELASKTAKLLRENPRQAIERVFRLSTPQAENLKNLSDDELAKQLEPIASAIEQGKTSQINVNYGTVPVVNDSFDSAATSRLRTVITITITIENKPKLTDLNQSDLNPS